MSRNTARTAAYWTTTLLVALSMTFGGVAYLLRFEFNMKGMAALGYPVYFVTLLGVWKLLGVAAVLAPKLPRLKEWAYAGIAFNLSGAVVSHLSVQEPLWKIIAPSILLGLTFASWALRPAGRRLGTVLPDAEGQSEKRAGVAAFAR